MFKSVLCSHKTDLQRKQGTYAFPMYTNQQLHNHRAKQYFIFHYTKKIGTLNSKKKRKENNATNISNEDMYSD